MMEWLHFEVTNCNENGECEQRTEIVIQSYEGYHVPVTH
jgi:hypothetical protein